MAQHQRAGSGRREANLAFGTVRLFLAELAQCESVVGASNARKHASGRRQQPERSYLYVVRPPWAALG